MTERIASDDFVKVYSQILESSIAANYELRHFFEDLLKLADWRTGVVDMTPESIGRRINLPEKKVLKWICELEKPDPASRTALEEGRRIIRLDQHRNWGWRIVNYEAYRLTRCMEERKAYNRRKQAEHRAKKKALADSPSTQQSKDGHATCERLHGIPASPEEVVSYGKTINPAVDEKTCRAFFAFYEGQARTSPSGDTFWVTGGGGVITRWREKLPSFNNGGKHDNDRRGGEKRTDGNVGTLNEGKASQYRDVGKLV